MIYLVRRKSFSTVLECLKRAMEAYVWQLSTSYPQLSSHGPWGVEARQGPDVQA